jgi:YegS/Rv2252/BmrU family lipid kinase
MHDGRGDSAAGTGAAGTTISAALVVNTHSRRGRALLVEAQQALEGAGVELVSRHALVKPSELRRVVREQLARDPDVLVVGAGDGTVAQVAGLLAGSRTALGLLPFGTTNNAARSLGIPIDLQGAVAAIASGARRRVDLGLMDDDAWFANELTLGLNAEVAARVPDGLKKVLGRLAYFLVGTLVFLGHSPVKAHLVEGDHETEVHTHQLIVANGSFHGGSPLHEEARIADGRLGVYRLGGPWPLQALLHHVLLALHLRPHFEREVVRVQDALIVTTKPRRVEVDGEPMGTTPVRVRVAPGALLVAAPADERSDAADGRSGEDGEHGADDERAAARSGRAA